ncbi:DNA polymerase III subunit epsilon [Psychrobacter sp. I-STPA6b]|uniref:DNA polymerase III subunit epsilon n=1 Tax=Psychrobacter sp. I-STPA6b TaxID=2585718 RepID=UPI001D0CD9AC|nr:DNA polymerase III subunit epsilon [Psychrobacter sp. I-STPA6b]
MSVLTAKPNTTLAFTDGACKGNPGAGGWGAYLVFADGNTQELYGGEDNTTNNRMELMGAIQALQHSPKTHLLEIWTDSSYVKNGITQWIAGWKQKGWKTANKKPVANQDLWQQLDTLCQSRPVEWHWVKGHAGHEGNEKADELANKGASTIIDKPNNSQTDNSQPTLTNTMTESQIPQAQDDWINSDPLGFGLSDIEDMPMSDISASEPDINPTVNNDHISQPVTSAPTISEPEAIDIETPFDGDTSRANPNFKPRLPIPHNRHENDRQLIMDTETTGLDPNKGDRIIEVGIVELVGRKFTGEKLHVYINPERGMDEEVIRIHGISEAFLADKPTFSQVAQQLYDFMAGAEIIAHNAPFDISFLSMEFDKVGLTDFVQTIQVTDSLMLAKHQYPGQKNTLDALVRRLNVGKQDRTFHGALLDAEILAEVYLAMTGGQVSLAIDEDTVSDSTGGGHASFAHLASQLISSPTDDNAHQNWLSGLSERYPELLTRWG